MKFSKLRFSRYVSEAKRFFSLETNIHKAATFVNLFALSGGIFFVVMLLTYDDRPLESRKVIVSLSGVLFLLATNVILTILALKMRYKWIQYQQAYESDELTGVLSRINFEKILEGEIRRAGRYRLPLTLCHIDVDGFTSFNDVYGKHKSDEHLKKFANLVQGTIRVTDAVGRYENDEFSVILPHTDLVRSEKFVARMLGECERKTDATFCAGLTPYRPGENKTHFLMRARLALHQAKKDGQKKVTCLIGSDDEQTFVQF